MIKGIQSKEQRGITLIALVITIIITVILAGVAINLTVGENGLFTKAKQAREKMQIVTITEKLELEKADLIVDSKGSSLTLSKYIERLIEKEIITNANIENTEYDNSKLITVDGYVFLLTEQDGDIKIEIQGKEGDVIIIDRTKPVVTIQGNTANTISITITDNSSGVVGYAYSKTNSIPQAFIECENKLDMSITIDGLKENTTYYIWAKDAVGNISDVKTATTSVANYSLNSGVKYNTLAQAVENTVAGDTIKLISDYTDTSDVTINKNITLNTNEKTLTRTKPIEIASGATVEIAGAGTLTTAEEINLIENKGTLNITHVGTISNTNTGAARTINNSGTVNKTGEGTIECVGTKPTIAEGNINISGGSVISTGNVGVYTSSTANISNDVTISGVDNAMFLVGNASTVVSGGNFTASKYDGIYTGGNSSLKIDGGTIEGINSAIYHESTNTIQVNNGTLIGKTQNGISIVQKGTGNVEINGGKISGKYNGISKNTSGKLIINGGIIKAISEWDGINVVNEDTGDIVITGGNIEGINNGIYTQGNGKINISAGTLLGNKHHGICIDNLSKTTITVSGGNITGNGDCGIWIGEKCEPKINIKEGTITAELFGIYVMGKTNIEISGGEIISHTQSGIYIQKQGKTNLIMSNEKIVANGYYGIATEGSNSEINISGGTVEGEHDGIILTNNGNNIQLNVLKGNLIGRQYDGIGVYANAIVNIGDGTKTIDNNSLSIYGKNYGVCVSGDCISTTNYNNGTLKGTIAGYTGNVNIRNGYTANSVLTSGVYVTTLK